jgi:hypothetical protein
MAAIGKFKCWEVTQKTRKFAKNAKNKNKKPASLNIFRNLNFLFWYLTFAFSA